MTNIINNIVLIIITLAFFGIVKIAIDEVKEYVAYRSLANPSDQWIVF